MRLIDKEALCGLLADKALEAQLEDECTELAIKECLSVVRQMPEAVVRCRECKHYKTGVCLKIYYDGLASRYAWQERKPDDFCSYGEKRRDKDGTT